mmetsp:Transcript_1819/g.6495  ORF Transcript_1819/g.6495 Transcript_1819/m.6495 type:complete len:257 (+) Transcript_1819:116-886(+)
MPLMAEKGAVSALGGSMEERTRRRLQNSLRGSSDNWKEQLTKRCLARIKERHSRRKEARRQLATESADEMECDDPLFDEKNSTVMADVGSEWDALVKEEWRLMKLEQQRMNGRCPALSNDDYVDVMTELERGLFEHQRQCELEMLQQWEEVQRFEAEALEQQLQEANAAPPVVCVLCKKDRLFQHRNVIFCQCGFRLDLKADCIDLAHFEARVRGALVEHSANQCYAEPQFELKVLGQQQLLIMSCVDCSFVSIVL